MATIAELIAKLGLDNSDFNKGIQDSQNKAKGLQDGLEKTFSKPIGAIAKMRDRIKNLQKNLEEATDIKSIAKYNIRLEQARAELGKLQNVGLTSANSIDKVSQAMNRQSKAIQGMQKQTSNYNSVGIDFARIIQDAPYGIIGVGNNITQLAQSFGTLRSQSTSTGAALKTAFASVFSSGNLLILGVSALTTVFTVLQQKGFFNTEKSAESLTEQLEEYRKKLEAVKKAQIEGRASAEGEIQDYKLLKAQAENTLVPMNKRIEAVKELQSRYPNYLGNLTQEQILTGNVGNAYKDLATEIIATAKARAASEAIAKNALDSLTLEEQQIARVNDLISKREKLTKLEAMATMQANKSRGETTGLDLQIYELRKEIKDLELEQVDSVVQRNKINQDNLRLESEIVKQIGQGARFTETQLNDLKEITIERQKQSAIMTPSRNPFDLSEPSKYSEKVLKNVKGITEKLIDPALKGAISQGIIIPQEAIDRINLAKEEQAKFNQEMTIANTLTGMLAGTFQSAFEGMLNSGKVSFKGIIDGLKALIIKLIAAAGAALALNVLLGGIGLGGAKFGGMEGFKALFSSLSGIPKFAEGGMVTGMTMAVLGDNPSKKEAVIPFEKMGGFLRQFGTGSENMRVEVVGSLRGEDIFFSGQNYQNGKNKILGF